MAIHDTRGGVHRSSACAWTVAGSRKALDTATRQLIRTLNPPDSEAVLRRELKARIDWLHAQGKLTDDLNAWAHLMRGRFLRDAKGWLTDVRRLIFYSLVATEEKDRLAYFFPSKLDRDQAEEVDHNLRLQRLNVGLSRAQEKIVFVHSKSPEKYAQSRIPSRPTVENGPG